ncbi:hypothetical protein TRVA0_033S00892 [Trichomonascus vanleenenianus]|uniref:uncharacterized protein n=1 Tax=Trichomonascus vanleenenianus TaxID=2268995 RepID=UPI003ECA4ADB
MIIAVDFDAFYCGVEEKFDPTLVGKPFIVYQKNCIATLSYAARNLGVKKLGRVDEAIKKFPFIKLVSGESLSLYRSEGKMLWDFIQSLVPSAPIERLGLEEMWIDVTPIIDGNIDLLTTSGMMQLLFDGCSNEIDGIHIYLSDDRTIFCERFAVGIAGKTFPEEYAHKSPDAFLQDEGLAKLYIASFIGEFIQKSVKCELGYSCSIGIAHNKTLAKMVTSRNKPAGLTSLVPHFTLDFLDPLPITKVPYCGRKSVQLITSRMNTPEVPSIREARQFLDKHPELKAHVPINVINLFYGVDESTVKPTSRIPQTISIENTYARAAGSLTMTEVESRIAVLVSSLLSQIKIDLLDKSLRWLARPSTLRLSIRTWDMQYPARKSKSAALKPSFFALRKLIHDRDVEMLAQETLVPELMKMFRQIVTQKKFDISMINIGVTGMKQNGNGSITSFFA